MSFTAQFITSREDMNINLLYIFNCHQLKFQTCSLDNIMSQAIDKFNHTQGNSTITTADASNTYTVLPINCQATTGPMSSVGNIENDSSSNLSTSSGSSDQGTLKVFAPILTHDVTLPNTNQEVPMVMVPVPDSKTLMAIPMSTLNQLKDSRMDEQQARDLLTWSDGIGTLDGCDLRFKLNQLGCLELLDSDDETLDNTPRQQRQKQQQQQIAISVKTSNNNNINNNNSKTHSSNMRQISPGSSLLRDGPNTRRLKTSTGRIQQLNSLIQQNTILLDKLVPKQKLDEIKSNVDQWNIEDVKDFIDSIPGCSGNGQLFESQQICGKSLMYLDQRDLLDVINVKLGPAVKIYHAISLLKRSQ